MIPVSSLPQWLYAIPWLSGTIGPRVHSPWPIAVVIWHMNKIEKSFIVGSYIWLLIYIVLFNINVPSHFGYGEELILELLLYSFWLIAVALSLSAIVITLIDIGKRNLNNKVGLVIYVLLLSAISVIHYFIKYGRNPRQDAI